VRIDSAEELFGGGGAARADLFGGEAVEGRGGDVEEAEVEIDLAAVVNLVFEHEAEPLPGRDGGGVGSLAFALEVGVGEAGEDFERFGVELFHEAKDFIEAVGEFFAVSGVAGGTALDGFGPHVALGDGDVAEEIAEGEFVGGVGPVDFVGRDAAGDAHGAFAYVMEVVEERLDGLDFHGALAE
jgi:hypothetical protein